MQLHRPDVLAGAMKLLDSEGLDNLTMRKLATSLDVQAGALYWHFKNKQALLDAMADELLAGVGDVLPEGPWEQQLELLAQRYRTALMSHRDGARVVAGAFAAAPNTANAGRAAVNILLRAGIEPEQSGWIYSALEYYILGHTIEEQSQHGLADEGVWEQRADDAIEAAPDANVARALRALIDSDPAERFMMGLRLFINGIRAESPRQRTASQACGRRSG